MIYKTLHIRSLPIIIRILPACALLVACSFSNRDHPQEQSRTTPTPTKYSAPAIPSVIANSQQRTHYLIDHYWDNFAFSDTSILLHSPIPEQAFTQYVSLLREVSIERASEGINRLIKLAESKQQAVQFFVQLAEKYFHNPNSPVRNDLLYEPFLKAAIASPSIDKSHRLNLQKAYNRIQKNKPGSSAADFLITFLNGSTLKLYDIESEWLLLYFHNPDCAECKSVKQKLVQSEKIQELSKLNRLRILSLYPDKELKVWKESYRELPSGWMNGYDKGTVIQEQELYDLQAIPSLYLLDSRKRVVLRDASFEEIEAALTRLRP